MTEAAIWLEQAQGLAMLPGDADRLHQHWAADRALLDRALEIHATSNSPTLFDRSTAAFDRMIGR